MIETVVDLVGEIGGAHSLEGETHLGFAYGTLNYDNLFNHPYINNVELKGNLEFEDLGIAEISVEEINEIFSEIIAGDTV